MNLPLDDICHTARPESVAHSLRSKRGFVFLDSSLAGPGARSFLGAEPGVVMTGGSHDWPAFEAALASRRRSAHDPFGAAVGWVGFDGNFCFGFFDQLHVFDHDSGRWGGDPPPSAGMPERSPMGFPKFQVTTRPADFVGAVTRAKAYIAAGDIYQVCLSHPLRCEFSGDAYPYYEALRHVSPAPYSAFLDLEGTQVASASPECFLRMNQRDILTQPIKGTRRRELDTLQDDRAARELLSSAKESAELIMITDLERNDLGRVCEYGSVHVTELLKLEKFRQVHHLLSTIRGTLRPDVSHAAALQACFPGGSISGAPKKRALEIIRELEPWTRGIYTGAIGYFGYHEESQFSIAIRTAIFREGHGELGMGAGIVADSLPDMEWQETLDKAAGLIAASQFGR
ncbi:MAG: anthranilate synthase component I family protein [Terrimicrobiaceae bacterium]